jgi:anti-anti-sigma factor
MNIERKDTGGEAIFMIMEDLVSHNINNLTDELNHFIRNDTRDAIIDLTYVRKIDSISIAALIRFKNALAEDDRTMQLTNPNETILRVLELAGLEKFLLES